MNHAICTEPSRRVFASAVAAMLLGGAAGAAVADTFPSKPVRLVVNFAAGGSTDVMARALAKSMSGFLGQPVVIDNRAGALGAVGASSVARSPADGYTLLMTTQGSMTEIPVISANPPYDSTKAFAPVGLVGESPFVIFAHPSFPANNVQELLAYAKARPEGVDVSVSGSSVKLGVLALGAAAGTKLVQIPYGGAGPAVNAALAGHTSLGLNAVTSSLMENVKAGKLKLLGVGSSAPYKLLPGVAPVAATIPGYTAQVWWGVFAPSGTPAAIVNKLNAALKQGLSDATVESVFHANATMPVHSSPEALGKLVTEGLATTAQLVKTHNIPKE
jgi:tripartite-type tricarboxylate transporter receptor subunit TctC